MRSSTRSEGRAPACARAPVRPRRPDFLSLAVALLALGAAACGGRVSAPARTHHAARSTRATSAPTGARSSVPAAAGSATSSSVQGSAASAGACTALQLSLSVQGPTGAAGEIVFIMVLRNGGTTSCTVAGVPQLSMLGRSGAAVGKPLQAAPDASPVPVTLAPGAHGTATVLLYDPSIYGCPTGSASSVRLVPPGSARAVTAALPRAVSVCTGVAPGAVGSNATVTPGTVDPVQGGAPA